MRAMILAAGRGERMRPLTDRAPKPLLQIGGKPLIVWLIERLVRAGLTDLVINISHLGEQIEAALGNGAKHGVNIVYSREHDALETAGGIAQALPLIGAAPFVVANSDVYSNYDFSALRRIAQGLTAQGRIAHLVLTDNPAHHPQGDFCLREGIVAANGVSKLTFSGIGAYHPALFQDIVPGAKCQLAAQLAAPIAQGRVSGEHFRGEWNDVGTPQRLAQLDMRVRGDTLN